MQLLRRKWWNLRIDGLLQHIEGMQSSLEQGVMEDDEARIIQAVTSEQGTMVASVSTDM